MSLATLNFHGVTQASARVSHVKESHWLTLNFVNADGTTLEVTLFSESPEALLQSLAGKAVAEAA